MIEEKVPPNMRISHLEGYLIQSFKYKKPLILFALYLSEFFRADVEKSLTKSLKEQGLEIVNVDAREHKDLPAYFSSIDSNNIVFFVHNIEKSFSDSLQYLNFKREHLVEHKVKVVFWTREEELVRISAEAPDFFAFRNRVVEFMEGPKAEEQRYAPVEFGLETENISWDNIKRSIELKEKLLSELSGEDEISEYLLGSLGILYYQIGSYKKSIEYSEKAVKIAQDIDNKQGEGMYYGNLGNAYHVLGNLENAIEFYEKAMNIAQEIGNRKSESSQVGNIGNVYRVRGETRKSIRYYEKALTIAQKIGDRRNEGIWLGNLGIDCRLLGKMENAFNYLEKAMKISQEIRDKRNESRWLTDIGLVHRDLGNVTKAMKYYKKALKIAQETRDIRREGFLFGEFGFAYCYCGEVKKAEKYYEKALKIAWDIGDRSNESKWLGGLGKIYHDFGEEENAVTCYEKAIKMAQEIGNKRFEGRWLNDLGEVFRNEKKYKEALACFMLAKDIRIQIEDTYLETTESNIKNLKEELSEEEFRKLEVELAPGATEIVRKMLEGTNEKQ